MFKKWKITEHIAELLASAKNLLGYTPTRMLFVIQIKSDGYDFILNFDEGAMVRTVSCPGECRMRVYKSPLLDDGWSVLHKSEELLIMSKLNIQQKIKTGGL